MANVFDQFDAASGGNVFDQFDEGAVAPGDVEARRRQVFPEGAAAQPDEARERLSIPNELAQGLVQGIGGIYNAVRRPTSVIPSSPTLQGVLESSIPQAVMGAARFGGGLMAPLVNYATKRGEAATKESQFEKEDPLPIISQLYGQPITKSDVKAGLRSAIIEGGAPTAIAGAAKAIVGATPKRFLTSKRMRAKEAATEFEHSVKADEADIERLRANAEAAKAELPTAEGLRERFAPDAPLGEEAGAAWKKGFSEAFNESKARNKAMYDPLEAAGASIDTTAENYAKAGGKLEAGKGITGIPGTKPESIAQRIKQRLKGLDDASFEDDTYDALKKQLDSAPPGDQERLKATINEFLGDNAIPEKPTVRDLILERRRLKAGQRAVRDDNSKRQFKGLIDALEEDIAAGSEEIAEGLFKADEVYAKEHAPFFSKGSVTRAIADGDASTVVDSIYKPSVTASGRALKNKSVETMERARTVIKDPAEWDKINRAFINKGVEASLDINGDFSREKFLKWWKSYSDPQGTGNKVLRTGLGEQTYREMNSVVNQLQRTSAKSIDKMLDDAVKGINVAQAARKKAIMKEVQSLVGNETNISRRLQGIGAGILASGAVTFDKSRFIKGLGIALSSEGLAKLWGTVQGRNLFKAMARTAPGTSQAMAVSRQIDSLLKETRED